MMPPGVYPRKDLKTRFAKKVYKTSSCWLWIGSISKDGYGLIKNNGKLEPAHRISWQLIGREVPEGMHVLHACDMRQCVRPDHLFIGTKKQNAIDGAQKGSYGYRAFKTHCKHGHELNSENTYVYGNFRHCKKCHNIREAKRRANRT